MQTETTSQAGERTRKTNLEKAIAIADSESAHVWQVGADSFVISHCAVEGGKVVYSAPRG